MSSWYTLFVTIIFHTFGSFSDIYIPPLRHGYISETVYCSTLGFGEKEAYLSDNVYTTSVLLQFKKENKGAEEPVFPSYSEVYSN